MSSAVAKPMDDSHTHAMADGKARVAREIVWALDFAGRRTRCRPVGEAYDVELKVANSSWLYVTTGTDPYKLLTELVNSKLVVDRILGKVSAATP